MRGERLRRARGAGLVILAAMCATPVAGQSTLRERVDALIRAHHALGRFNGAALIVYDGEPLVQEAYGFARIEDGGAANGVAGDGRVPNRIDTRFRIASPTGSFTAALILRLWEMGTLELDAPVREYIPEYPAPQGDRVTIHHLLTHTSGIPGQPDLRGSLEGADEPPSPAEIVALTWTEPLRFDPGSEFDYDDAGYVLLGWLAERVTGRPYEELLRELVLDPAGLHDTGYEDDRPPGTGRAHGYTRSLAGVAPARIIDPTLPHSAGMLYSTVGDLGRWAEALSRFEPGRPFERPGTLERMLTPHLGGFGYGMTVETRPIGREDSVRVVRHRGGISGFRSALRVFPEHGRAIVLLDNTSSDLGPLAEGLTNLLWGAEAPHPKPSIARRLLPIIETAGVEAALDRYRNWRRTRPDGYDYGPDQLVRLARHLMDGERPDDALPVLRTAIELYPRAAGAGLLLHELHLAAGDTARAVSALEAALTWRPGEPRLLQPLLELGIEPPAVLRIPVTEVTVEAMERVTGSYRIDPATSLEIRREGEGLVAQRSGEAAFPLLPQSETTYLLEGSAIQLSFLMDGERAAGVAAVESGRRVTFPRIPVPR